MARARHNRIVRADLMRREMATPRLMRCVDDTEKRGGETQWRWSEPWLFSNRMLCSGD